MKGESVAWTKNFTKQTWTLATGPATMSHQKLKMILSVAPRLALLQKKNISGESKFCASTMGNPESGPHNICNPQSTQHGL